LCISNVPPPPSISKYNSLFSNHWPNPRNNSYVINANIEWPSAKHIDRIISDNVRGKLDVVVTGSGRSNVHRVVRLRGSDSNTFTGYVFVEGKGTALFLSKWSGAHSVNSDIYVRNGAIVGIELSNQIPDYASVKLQGGDSMFAVNWVGRDLSEKFRTLSVDGHGRVLFSRSNGSRERKTLILDDLVVDSFSRLTVHGWDPDLDLFLVAKSSEHARDALNRIRFEGPNRQIVELREYNKYYWRLYASPEPSTYGAIFGAVGVGLTVFRNRRNGAR